MSAWIVSKAHIDVLVEALFKYEVVVAPKDAQSGPDEIGHILWKENYRSVNYRYDERRRTPRYTHSSETLCYDRPGVPVGTVRELARLPWTTYALVRCYDYQTCERPDWEKSKAYELIRRLEEALCTAVGKDRETIANSPELKNQPWGLY